MAPGRVERLLQLELDVVGGDLLICLLIRNHCHFIVELVIVAVVKQRNNLVLDLLREGPGLSRSQLRVVDEHQSYLACHTACV